MGEGGASRAKIKQGRNISGHFGSEASCFDAILTAHSAMLTAHSVSRAGGRTGGCTDAEDEEQDAEDAEDRREGEGQRRHHVAQRPDLDAGRAVGTPAADAFIANPDRRLLRDARPRWALPAQT